MMLVKLKRNTFADPSQRENPTTKLKENFFVQMNSENVAETGFSILRKGIPGL